MEVWMNRHQIELLSFSFPAITGAELFSQKHTGSPRIQAYDNSIRPARGRLIADVQIGLKNAKPFGAPSMS